MRKCLDLFLVLLVGGLGGLLFNFLGLPLPWMLGALAISAVAAVMGRKSGVPPPAGNAARAAIGVMAGSAFTPDVVQTLALWWPSLIGVLAFTLVSIVSGFVYFHRLAGFDRVTAFFASAPGGLAELTILGGAYGGNLRALVLIHSVRIICVLAFLPILLQIIGGYDLSGPIVRPDPVPVGQGGLADWAVLIACGASAYLIARRFRIPGGVMIPALFLSAALHAAGWSNATVPGWLIAVVQVVIGSAAGARFFGVTRAEASGAVLWGMSWAVLLIGMAAAVAALATPVLGQPPGALLLAFSPGGTAEMTILSIAVGIEVAFVVTCQVSRIMMVYTLAPLLFALFRWRGVIAADVPPPNRKKSGQ